MRIEDWDDRQLVAELLREHREDLIEDSVSGYADAKPDRLARIDSLLDRLGDDV